MHGLMHVTGDLAPFKAPGRFWKHAMHASQGSNSKLAMLCRLVRRQEETRAQRGQMKQLKGLMHGLVNVTGDPEKQQLDAIRNARQLAFLITDLQDSTAMASANAAAFRKVQDIHDTVSLCLSLLLTMLLLSEIFSSTQCPDSFNMRDFGATHNEIEDATLQYHYMTYSLAALVHQHTRLSSASGIHNHEQAPARLSALAAVVSSSGSGIS